ncbi:MAG: hypothetical protein V7609_3465 [Verrucomicrobiota bacterium]
MMAHHWGFAGPLLERLFPSQRNQRGGDDDFEEEAHGGIGKSEVGSQRSAKSDKGDEVLKNLDPRQGSSGGPAYAEATAWQAESEVRNQRSAKIRAIRVIRGGLTGDVDAIGRRSFPRRLRHGARRFWHCSRRLQKRRNSCPSDGRLGGRVWERCIHVHRSFEP